VPSFLSAALKPSPSLMAAVGIPKKERDRAKPLATMQDLIEERTGAKPGQGYGGMFKLNPQVADLMESYSVEGPDKVEVLVLGTISKAGNGCFCPESTLLKRVMDHLLLEEDEIVIMDMEAGLEHLGRATARSVDLMLIVVEPGQRSMETASNIDRMSRELGIKHVAVVLNKISSPEEDATVRRELDAYHLDVIAALPFEKALVDADLAGSSVFDAPGVEKYVAATRALKAVVDERARSMGFAPAASSKK